MVEKPWFALNTIGFLGTRSFDGDDDVAWTFLCPRVAETDWCPLLPGAFLRSFLAISFGQWQWAHLSVSLLCLVVDAGVARDDMPCHIDVWTRRVAAILTSRPGVSPRSPLFQRGE